jgi:hypothetical protein
LIYLQPQFRSEKAEILNVKTKDDKVVGYVAYVYEKGKDIYVHGHLEDIGEKQNFIDIVTPFITGLKEACGIEEDPFVHIYCGGEEVDLSGEDEQKG